MAEVSPEKRSGIGIDEDGKREDEIGERTDVFGVKEEGDGFRS